MVSDIVLDSSCLVAIIRDEAGADAVATWADSFHMAMPNVVEVCDAIVRAGGQAEDVCRILQALSVNVVPFTLSLAIEAGDLFRPARSAGLSLGDRCCLALARTTAMSALTGDRAWLKVANDIGVKVELFR